MKTKEKREKVTPGSFDFDLFHDVTHKEDLLLQFASKQASNKEANPSLKSQLLCQLNSQQ